MRKYLYAGAVAGGFLLVGAAPALAGPGLAPDGSSSAITSPARRDPGRWTEGMPLLGGLGDVPAPDDASGFPPGGTPTRPADPPATLPATVPPAPRPSATPSARRSVVPSASPSTSRSPSASASPSASGPGDDRNRLDEEPRAFSEGRPVGAEDDEYK